MTVARSANRGPSAAAGNRRALVAAERIDYFAQADYRSGRKLEKRVRTILDVIIARVAFEREKHLFKAEIGAL